jgi:hypothetical protein
MALLLLSLSSKTCVTIFFASTLPRILLLTHQVVQ